MVSSTEVSQYCPITSHFVANRYYTSKNKRKKGREIKEGSKEDKEREKRKEKTKKERY